jgi:hypothetical protein
MRDEAHATNVSGSPSAAVERSTRGSAKLWVGLGIASAVIALVLLPPLFGGLGIVFGCLAKRRGSQIAGVVTMYISGIALVVGMVIGALLA